MREGHSFSGNLQILSVNRSMSLRRACPPFRLKALCGQYSLWTEGSLSFSRVDLVSCCALLTSHPSPVRALTFQSPRNDVALDADWDFGELQEMLGVGMHKESLCSSLCAKTSFCFCGASSVLAIRDTKQVWGLVGSRGVHKRMELVLHHHLNPHQRALFPPCRTRGA